jgi:methylglutaconyl-CoA hydratase
MQDLNQPYVKLEIQNKIGYVTFFHPNSNSLPGSLLRELATTIESASNSSEVNVIVLKSAGEKAFCAGASFDELVNITDLETGDYFFSGFALVINAIRNSSKFVIGRVQGKAVGGGVGLAAACDYTFASTRSDAKLSELALGIGPFVVGPAVERKIGTSAFAEMSIDYDWRSAEWSKSKGLYVDIFETTDALDAAVNNLATKLANNSPEAMADLKRVLWEGTENWDTLLFERAKISGRLVLSEFTKNYINEFKSKSK